MTPVVTATGTIGTTVPVQTDTHVHEKDLLKKIPHTCVHVHAHLLIFGK